MMQYRHLHYFVSVVEAGSFSRAASTVHVAQPALSQQIAQLEEQLGVSLLLRSARGVRPTAAGEVLYREASSILRRLQQLPGIAVRRRAGKGDCAARDVINLPDDGADRIHGAMQGFPARCRPPDGGLRQSDDQAARERA